MVAIDARAPRRVDHEIRIRGLDPRHDGVRIAHLSDVHVGAMTAARHVRRAVALANEAEPDLIALTGDYVCMSKRDVDVLGDQLAGLSAAPVAVVLGNHDYWVDGRGVARALDRLGYGVMRNESARLTVRGAPLCVVGIDDPVTRRHDLDASFAAACDDATRVVLCHGPELAPKVSRRGADLILSGHTHGGQIFIRGITDRIFDRFGLRYRSGSYQLGDAHLYVTAGVGASGLPLRAGPGARAEVAVLTLRPG